MKSIRCKQIIIFLFFLTVFVSFTVSACQRTPSSKIVINKNNGTFEQSLGTDKDYDPMSVSFPGHWEAELEELGGRLTVSIDADIFAEKKAYNVVKVEPYLVPIEQVDKIIEALFGTTKVYSFDDDEMTKGQIESYIIDLKKAKTQAESDRDYESAQDYERVISELSAKLNTAPDEMEMQLYNHSFASVNEEGLSEDRIVVKKEILDLKAPYLYVRNTYKSNHTNVPKTFVNYISKYRTTYSDISEWNHLGDGFENMIFNTDEATAAITVANDFLKEVGINDRVIESISALTKDDSSDVVIGYRMAYGKKYDDVLIYSSSQSGGQGIGGDEDTSDTFSIPFIFEYLGIEVENGEIVQFQWSDVFEMGNIIKENVALQPFEIIMSNTEKQLIAKYAYLETFDESIVIYIDNIVLTYAVEPIRDSKGEYMLIPVWAFYGGRDYGEGQTMRDGSIREGKVPSSGSLLTVSAIDGLVIHGN